METEILGAAQEIDFSMWALFARATLIVKLVMILLIVASFWSWAIIVQKIINYRRAREEAQHFDRAFWSGEPLDELFDKIGPQPSGAAENVFAAGMMEWRRSHRQDGNLIAGAQARIDRSMDVAIAKESEKLNSGLSFLATVGSTAPFVGLFRHRLGHHERVYRDCSAAEHEPCRCRAGYCRGAFGDRAGPAGRYSGGDLLQHAVRRQRSDHRRV